MASPSTPRLVDREEPLTPTTAKRKGFGFFERRFQSPSSDVDAPPRRLSYQPRIKSPAIRGEHHSIQSPGADETSTSTIPFASTSTLPNGAEMSARSQSKRKSTPGKIQIDHSAQHLSNATADTPKSPQEVITAQLVRRRTSASAKSADDSTPTAIPALIHKRRQPSQVLEVMRRNSKNRQYSWGSDQGRGSRQAFRRSVSSPVEAQPSIPRRESIAGSKPVAPSFHPDAPDELKVKPPSKSVLLPFLSIPGVNKDSNGEASSHHISPDSPADFNAESVLKSNKIKHQRPGIKVRIITWNQGSSVPKGNLEALLGRVGEYIAPEEGWDESSDEDDEGEGQGKKRKHKGMGVAGQEKVPRKERIPPLPHDDAHPYHVVVVAGQECPWGDGKRIATGVGMAGELGDLGRSKSRAAQHARERHKDVSKGAKGTKDGGDKYTSDDKIPSSAVEGEFPFSETPGRSVPSTPLLAVPSTPGGAAGIGAWGIGGKGWSDMCEDWLCRGPLAQATATKGLAHASRAMTTPSPLLTPLATPDDGMSPTTSRATTPNAFQVKRSESMSSLAAPALKLPGPVETETSLTPSLSSKVISQDHFYNSSPSKNASLAVPRQHSTSRRFSLANRSKEILDPQPALLEESQDEDDAEFRSVSPTDRPLSPIKQTIDTKIRLPAHHNKQIPGKPHHRLGLHIPGLSAGHHVTVQSDGTPLSLGAYELVAKERCYMMYMAVYVWRGCLNRVVKTSQGHVKSGLLAGRVGNKGCVGISLKLGSSRLLFVNAHLAAHEGKIAERIANVEKIKKELKVDTFLPPEDPRNKADDVTEAFDYAFWMGDLNFRVDISRQHADWLLMKKQYQDALAFDQLLKVMKEQPKVFNGFSEAPITFPPTFKYDVLKTIKHKNEEKARKLKATAAAAASTPSKAIDSDGLSIEANRSSVLPSSSVLTDAVSQSSKANVNGFVRENDAGLLREDKREECDDDASSFTSSAWGSSAPSASGGHMSDREQRRGSLTNEGDASFLSQASSVDPVVSNNTAAAEGHRLHGKVIKAKKRFLDVVNSIGSHAQKKEEEYVPEVVKLGRQMKEKASREEKNRRRTSNADCAAKSDAENGYKGGSVEHSVSGGHVRSDSYTIVDDVPPNPQIPLTHKSSIVGDISEGSPPNDYNSSAMQPASSVSAMTEEYERQPYDTSAKQRVPSWCDRVLWKSNVKVQQEEEEEEAYESSSHGLSSRVGHAISNAIHSNRRHHLSHHRRDSARPSVTFATLKSSHGQGRSVTSTSNESASPSANIRSASPRKGWFVRSNSGQKMKRSSTMDPQHLGSGGNKSRSATDLPSVLARSQSERSDILKGGRHEPTPPRSRKSSLETTPRQIAISPLSQDGERDLMEEHAKKLAAGGSSHRRGSSKHESSNLSPVVKSAPLASTSDKRTSWWNDLGVHLSSFLTPQGAFSAFNGFSPRNDNEDIGGREKIEKQETELIGPTKGQIECLSYRSLTDAEMRALDARSDHYAVMGVYCIGI